MFDQLGRDVWSVIGSKLSIRDLLALRQTSRAMNNIVKQMNDRWYRAYQWFIITKVDCKKAKSAMKVHRPHIKSVDCVPQSHPLLVALSKQPWTSAIHVQWHQTRKQILESKDFDRNNCENRYHWAVVVPNEESEIPLGKHYIKKREYMYHYLIECYRYYSHKHSTTLADSTRRIRQLESEKKDLERRWRDGKRQLEEAEERVEALKKKYVGNDAFKTVKYINRYNGV